MKSRLASRQTGITLVGLIFLLAIFGFIGLLGLKVTPTVTEFLAVKKAIFKAKDAGATAIEVRNSFDRQAETGYIESVNGKDLELIKDGDRFEISVAYQKKIPVAGPVSLLIDYEASTSPRIQAKAQSKPAPTAQK